MSDLIDRQAAIDAFTDEIQVTGRSNAESIKAYVKLVIDRIKRLPSAQPKKTQLSTENTTSDCISRQAAIDAIERNTCNTQRAIDAVMGLPSAQPEQQWIPCSERLPKEGEVVLITNEKGNVKHGQYRGCYPSDKVDWWWWKKNTTEQVIAWKPLPAAYEERREE